MKFLPVVRGIVVVVMVVSIGLLSLPLLIALAFIEEWMTSDRRAEQRAERQGRSRGRGVFVRY